LTSSQDAFVRLAGEMAENFSFNRSVGQIYGVLYVSREPLALEDIAKRLGMSKGNASINLRALEGWGAVRPVWVAGSRKDHYEANRDLKALLLRRVEEGLSKRLDLLETRLAGVSDALAGNDADSRFAKEQLKSVASMAAKARKALNMLPKVVKFLG